MVWRTTDMIIIRQKEYSSRTAKFLRAVNKTKDAVMVPIDNAGLKVGNALKSIVTGKETPSYMRIGFKRKTNNQINRETVGTIKTAKRKAKEAATEMYYTPGQTIDKGMRLAAENPITTATGVVGKVTMVTDPAGTGLVPWGNIGLATEQAAKKWGPYKKATEAMGRAHERTVGRVVRSIPSVPEMAMRAQNLGHVMGL